MIPWDDVCRLAKGLNGLPVLRCRPGSPSALAGVRYGDILLSVNHRPTPDWGSYIEARALEPTKMVIEVFRDGQTLMLSLDLPPRGEAVDPHSLLQEILAEGGVPGTS